jgi:hypothetical protein
MISIETNRSIMMVLELDAAMQSVAVASGCVRASSSDNGGHQLCNHIHLS